MRRCDYEELSETRVRSWGNRGLTRRINKQYGTPGRPPLSQRKGITSRVVDVFRGIGRKGKRGDDAAREAAAPPAAAPAAAAPPPPSPSAKPTVAPAKADLSVEAAAARWERTLGERRALRTSSWSLRRQRGAAAPEAKRVGWLKRAWRGLAGRRT